MSNRNRGSRFRFGTGDRVALGWPGSRITGVITARRYQSHHQNCSVVHAELRMVELDQPILVDDEPLTEVPVHDNNMYEIDAEQDAEVL